MTAFGDCVSQSEMDDILLEYEDKAEARYCALESFTIQTLREQNNKLKSFDERLKDVEMTVETSNSNSQSLNDSLGCLREELDEMKASSVEKPRDLKTERSRSLNVQGEDSQLGTPRSPVKKKLKVPTLFARKVEVSVPRCAPKRLEDLSDDDLRQKLAPFYGSKVVSAEKLTPVQLAFIHYYFNRFRQGEFSARSEVLADLYARGVEVDVWFNGWTPEGIKRTFRDYLKDKIRNLNKKKIQDAAAGELVEKLMDQE